MGAKRLHRETAGQPQNRLQKYYIIICRDFWVRDYKSLPTFRWPIVTTFVLGQTCPTPQSLIHWHFALQKHSERLHHYSAHRDFYASPSRQAVRPSHQDRPWWGSSAAATGHNNNPTWWRSKEPPPASTHSVSQRGDQKTAAESHATSQWSRKASRLSRCQNQGLPGRLTQKFVLQISFW